MTSKVEAIHKKEDDAVIIHHQDNQESQPNTQQRIDEEDVFDINPIRKKCTYCNVEVVTYVEHEGHPLFLIFALIVIMIFGYLSVIMLPISFLLSKSAVHRCSRCLQKLGEKQCFGIPTNIYDEIWQFRLGKCHIVISRGYALIVLTIFTIFSLYYVYNRPSYFTPLSPFEEPKESFQIESTWEEFLKDCGGEVVVENYVHARATFNRKYENNQITWSGYFAESKQTQQAIPFFSSDHAINILVKMMPSESALYPDLVLSVPTKLYNEKSHIIKNLAKGEEIIFKAKVISLGNEFKMHHLHAIDIEKTGNKIELSQIIVRESTLP